MIFSQKSQSLLSRMCIDSESYSAILVKEFNDDAVIFNKLLEAFESSDKINNDVFKKFWVRNTGDTFDSKICNWVYELFNNLRRFFDGGVFKLFTSKQVEWGAPEVIITKKHVEPSNVNLLKSKQTIYRGMSQEEHSTKEYKQSWTLDYAIAKKFAYETYTGWHNRIVIETVVNKNDIIYYDKTNGEKEVIIKSGCIIEAHEIKA